MIYWSAKNNSSFMKRIRFAKTLRVAVVDARKYVDGELYGEGIINFYEDKHQAPIRTDEKSIFTGYKWKTK